MNNVSVYSWRQTTLWRLSAAVASKLVLLRALSAGGDALALDTPSQPSSLDARRPGEFVVYEVSVSLCLRARIRRYAPAI